MPHLHLCPGTRSRLEVNTNNNKSDTQYSLLHRADIFTGRQSPFATGRWCCLKNRMIMVKCAAVVAERGRRGGELLILHQKKRSWSEKCKHFG